MYKDYELENDVARGTLESLKYKLNKYEINYSEILEFIHEHRVVVTYSEYSQENIDKCLDILWDNLAAGIAYDCQHMWFFKKLEF